MIDVKDLMVGNYVLDRGGKTLRIDYFEQDKVCMEIEGSYLNPYPLHPLTEYFEYLQPIILSEEILLKCGFENKIKGNYCHKEFTKLYVNIGNSIGINFGNKNGILKFVDYLHELQNIFWILTKQELEIKL